MKDQTRIEKEQGRTDQQEQGRTDQQEQICREIIRQCRGILYRRYPYLDSVLAGLMPKSSTEAEGFGTDGIYFYYSGRDLIQRFAGNPERLIREVLHMLLHCLYLHILQPAAEQTPIWNLACDLAAEQILEQKFPELNVQNHTKTNAVYKEQNQNGTGKSGRSISNEADPDRTESDRIRDEILHLTGTAAFSPEQICRILENAELSCDLEELSRLFSADDHRFWIRENHPDAQGIRTKWERIRHHSGPGGGAGFSSAGLSAGSDQEEISIPKNGKNSYRKFLRQFTVMREEPFLDPDSFDPIYYTYGLEHYEEMPLIEPLETQEVYRLEELVIAIDTSGSCRRETVEAFLAETRRIFEERENFFHRMKVYLIQCDCVIQDVRIIHSLEEWEKIGEHLTIRGRAGTDFRPVFRYVSELQKKKELKNLKALLYFTDGDGTFPVEAPDYAAAVITPPEKETAVFLPKWAHRFILT